MSSQIGSDERTHGYDSQPVRAPRVECGDYQALAEAAPAQSFRYFGVYKRQRVVSTLVFEEGCLAVDLEFEPLSVTIVDHVRGVFCHGCSMGQPAGRPVASS